MSLISAGSISLDSTFKEMPIKLDSDGASLTNLFWNLKGSTIWHSFLQTSMYCGYPTNWKIKESGSDVMVRLVHTANKFWFVKSQKDLSKPHSQISTKFFKNTITIFCLELWYSVEKCSITVDAAIQLSANATIYFQKELWILLG